MPAPAKRSKSDYLSLLKAELGPIKTLDIPYWVEILYTLKRHPGLRVGQIVRFLKNGRLWGRNSGDYMDRKTVQKISWSLRKLEKLGVVRSERMSENKRWRLK